MSDTPTLYRVGPNFPWIVNIEVPVQHPDAIGEYTRRLVEAEVVVPVEPPDDVPDNAVLAWAWVIYGGMVSGYAIKEVGQ